MLCIEDWWPPYFIKKCDIVSYILDIIHSLLSLGFNPYPSNSLGLFAAWALPMKIWELKTTQAYLRILGKDLPPF
jgi:hypothetical protein